jgi:uncharacterized membrane protein
VISIKKMEETMSIILLLGVMISSVLVIIGGAIYLYQYGSENMHIELMLSNQYQTNAEMIWKSARTLSAVGIIELGLLALVITQIVRVALLVWFYGKIRDYWFILISTFILLVLIYSLIWRTSF